MNSPRPSAADGGTQPAPDAYASFLAALEEATLQDSDQWGCTVAGVGAEQQDAGDADTRADCDSAYRLGSKALARADMDAALEWFAVATEHHHPAAAFRTAVIVARRAAERLPFLTEEALRWTELELVRSQLTIAAEHGHCDARYLVNRLDHLTARAFAPTAQAEGRACSDRTQCAAADGADRTSSMALQTAAPTTAAYRPQDDAYFTEALRAVDGIIASLQLDPGRPGGFGAAPEPSMSSPRAQQLPASGTGAVRLSGTSSSSWSAKTSGFSGATVLVEAIGGKTLLGGLVAAQLASLTEEGPARNRAAAAPPSALSRTMFLGMWARELRVRSGCTQHAAATAAAMPVTTLARLERGQTQWRANDLERLLTAYKVPFEERELLHSLLQTTDTPRWWERYSDAVPATFLSLEASARMIRTYEPRLVPELLQTSDYARAIVRTSSPTNELHDVERRVTLRMRRQEILQQPTPACLWAVIDEAVLTRQVGERQVMKGQLQHLLDASRLPHITLQIVPASHRAPGTDLAWVHLRFGHAQQPDVAYIEDKRDALRRDDRNSAARHLEDFDRLAARALSAEQTRLRLVQDLKALA
ncbi:helix-turn-helix transcriptional regulator [Streptomyces sp. NPDC048251]|uniref:helix-turn-helix domain-containing protein n=1 Tax=Streptomyces sp. NPDC048251 TaxID=3154501 RepID=UPI0034205593